jgi:hypothetical protein
LVAGLVLLVWFAIAWMFLPYDSPFFSFLRLTSSKVSGTFRSPNADERLLLELPGQHPFTDEEVAYIVKTGYGTQERVPALLEASGALLKAGSEYGDNVLVVGDFATTLELKGRTVPIHDVVAAAIDHEDVVKTEIQGTERIQKYRDMTLAIQQGRKGDAEQLSKAVGWDLDALKVLTWACEMVPDSPADQKITVHTKPWIGVEYHAREEMVHNAGRRYIHHPTVALPIP